MEIGEKKLFDKDAAYERWDQRNQRRGNDKYFMRMSERKAIFGS